MTISEKNLTVFEEKFRENILTNFQLKFLDFGQKRADFTTFWKNLKTKKSAKTKSGSVAPVKHGFFFGFYFFFFLWP